MAAVVWRVVWLGGDGADSVGAADAVGIETAVSIARKRARMRDSRKGNQRAKSEIKGLQRDGGRHRWWQHLPEDDGGRWLSSLVEKSTATTEGVRRETRAVGEGEEPVVVHQRRDHCGGDCCGSRLLLSRSAAATAFAEEGKKAEDRREREINKEWWRRVHRFEREIERSEGVQRLGK